MTQQTTAVSYHMTVISSLFIDDSLCSHTCAGASSCRSRRCAGSVRRPPAGVPGMARWPPAGRQPRCGVPAQAGPRCARACTAADSRRSDCEDAAVGPSPCRPPRTGRHAQQTSPALCCTIHTTDNDYWPVTWSSHLNSSPCHKSEWASKV